MQLAGHLVITISQLVSCIVDEDSSLLYQMMMRKVVLSVLLMIDFDVAHHIRRLNQPCHDTNKDDDDDEDDKSRYKMIMNMKG